MALRLGSYNVQLFTDIQAKAASDDIAGAALALRERELARLNGTTHLLDPRQRARASRLAERVLDSPYDIVCFQEMWSEPAWWTLWGTLQAEYVWGIGGDETRHNLPTPLQFTWNDLDSDVATGTIINGEDLGSGLAVASRFPIVPFMLPGDTSMRKFAFVGYSLAGGVDGGARKGAGTFCVNAPGLGRVVVGFTHLQADYSRKPDGKAYDGIRSSQLEEFTSLLKATAMAANTSRIVACGDLNVRGEPVDRGPTNPPRSAEYVDIFGWPAGNIAPVHSFGKLLRDAWSYSSAEETAITNQDLERLDYVLTGAPGESDDPPRLVADHILLARNLFVPKSATDLVETPLAHGMARARGGTVRESDHTGVNAILWKPHAAGTPSQAFELLVDPGESSHSPPLHTENSRCNWLVLSNPGTYTVVLLQSPGDIGGRLLIFEPHDLSAPAAWADPAGVSPDLPAGFQDLGGKVVEVHRFGGPASRLFVRVTTDTDSPGEFIVGAYRHNGTTLAEAILVDPKQVHKLEVAPGHHDLWIELQLDGPPDNPSLFQTVHLDVKAPGVTLETFAPDGSSTPSTTTNPSLDHARAVFSRRGPERVLVRCNIPSVGPAPVKVEWETDLKAVHGPNFDGYPVAGAGPLHVLVDDETGWDIQGADETTIKAASDLHALPSIYHGDADTGEYLDVGFGSPEPVRFVETFFLNITEDDWFDDTTNGLEFPLNLPSGVGIPALSRRRPIRVGSGTYAFFYNVSGWLRRHNL